MLSELNIRNIAVISQADITFQKGFNVFTGETGAGKSILIGAIGAVLGFRTPKELIRTGETKASVSALFRSIEPSVCEKLALCGVTCDGELVISREITPDSTTCRINGQAVTTAMLRSVGALLMNIHGQMDNQMLSSPDYHRQFVDSFGELDGAREKYAAEYAALCALEGRLRSFEADARERERRIDLLRYQTQEIEACHLQSGEEQELHTRRDIIRNAGHLTELLSRCREALSGGDESEGTVSILEETAQNLSQAAKVMGDLEPFAQSVESFAYELEDISQEIRARLDDLEFDPREQDEIEERIDVINRLKKKYGDSVEEILTYCDNAVQELSELESTGLSSEKLRKQCSEARAHAESTAASLTEKRKEAAARFSAAVRNELKDLDMPHVVFEVSITPTELSSSGADAVEFLLSVNPGEAPKALAKIASGGEMSRIMLAIKNVISAVDDLGTLIFDEVDTGISGRAAQKVGAKLLAASRGRQILCVTHLAQVAAFADHHLLIEKEVRGGHTFTEVHPLDRTARVRELARIMSGETITAAALESAEQLLDFSRKTT
jgi:DNA repair protein RecN (Recombination protein N)